jgi:Domain of unknown function (DUF4062)
MPRGYPPSIFISSTCYDLNQVRLDLKRFIEGLGYDAVISESSNFPVNPQTTTIDNCVDAVRKRADILVLVVGARYGSVVPGQERSITNLEYLEAKTKGIPVYVFIAQQILHTLPIWRENRSGNFSKIVDTPRLFEFADYLQRESGEWVFDFNEVNDVIGKLRFQLALLFQEVLESRSRMRGARLEPALAELPAEPLRILLERPAAWEYRFFAAILRAELGALSRLRRDLHYGLRIGPVIPLTEPKEVLAWLSAQFERVTRLVLSAELLMGGPDSGGRAGGAIQEAIGPPGVSGNPSLLAYVAQKIAGIDEALMQWRLDFAMVQGPADFSRLFELAAKTAIDAITKLESLADLLDSEIDKAIAASERGEHYPANVVLTLTTPVPEEFYTELRRLRSRFL